MVHSSIWCYAPVFIICRCLLIWTRIPVFMMRYCWGIKLMSVLPNLLPLNLRVRDETRCGTEIQSRPWQSLFRENYLNAWCHIGTWYAKPEECFRWQNLRNKWLLNKWQYCSNVKAVSVFETRVIKCMHVSHFHAK
jgi:hypothetical protein